MNQLSGNLILKLTLIFNSKLLDINEISKYCDCFETNIVKTLLEKASYLKIEKAFYE